MKLLVTGADGFVGIWLVSRLREQGHNVVGGVRPGQDGGALPPGVRTIPFELSDGASVREAVREGWDGVVHLAGVSSGADANRDPEAAWHTNTVGTARLAHELGVLKHEGADPVLVLASSAEVYGRGHDEIGRAHV